MEPTVRIQLEPSSNPSSAPSVDDDTLSDCETTHVHCGDELSTCFSDFVSDGSWGWSIDLEPVPLDDDKCQLICAVYSGASECNYNKSGANLLGIVVISENAVVWAIREGYKAEAIHLYAGQCPYNDGGHHIINTSSQNCDEEAMRQNAALYKTYPLANSHVSPNLKTGFEKLDSTEYRTQKWLDNDYHVFPLGGASRRYLSAHATVCKAEPDTTVANPIAGNEGKNSLVKERVTLTTHVIGSLCAVLVAVVVALYYKRGKIGGGSVSGE